jgi:hypothetical protein
MFFIIVCALVERGAKECKYDIHKLKYPPSANLVVRKKIWVQNVKNIVFKGGTTGPKGTYSAEDTEALFCINNASEIWYNPKMVAYHQIPKQRLEKEHLVKLVKGYNLANIYLLMMFSKPWQKPFIFARTFLGGLKRLVKHLVQGGIKGDLVKEVELEWYKTWTVSPFRWLVGRLY